MKCMRDFNCVCSMSNPSCVRETLLCSMYCYKLIICCLRRSSDQNYSIDLGLFDVCTITHLHLNGKKLLEVIICIFFFF